jgi:riboflavin synthase
MFTGIIEETGVIKTIVPGKNSCRVTVLAKKILAGTRCGDSISVSGICLTVDSIAADSFSADLMPETLRRTAFAGLKSGSEVNLERALPADGRFGGHLVSGHIDGTGIIESKRREDNALMLRISAGKELLRFIIGKGSVALDGISLTVAEVDGAGFSVSLIPHTAKNVILPQKSIGSAVNIECDMVGKYLWHFVNDRPDSGAEKRPSITETFLMEQGF